MKLRSATHKFITKVKNATLKHLFVVSVLLGVPLAAFLLVKTSFLGVLAVDETDEPYSIFIVAGQSNAEGTNSFVNSMPEGQKIGQHPADQDSFLWWEGADGGDLNSPGAFFNTIVNPNYNPAGWIKSNNTADPSMGGLISMQDLNKATPMGQRLGLFGPEVGIARELYDQGRRKIIILKVTYGFQALAKSTSQFIPYDWYPDIPGQPSRNKSYAHLKSAYGELTDYLKTNQKKYTVDGMFWSQGETDTLDSGYADKYEENFELLVNRAREDFHFHPNAHFVARKFNLRTCIDNAYPATGSYCGFGYALQMEGVGVSNILQALTINAAHSIPLNNVRIRKVRDGMQRVADKYKWVDMVETDDVPFAGDYIHLNAQGQLIAGKRMAGMFKPPYRAAITSSLSSRNDYDGDGVPNSGEDNGRGLGCLYEINGVKIPNNDPVHGPANNSNLGDDDSDCDGFPDYLDNINGTGSGMIGL